MIGALVGGNIFMLYSDIQTELAVSEISQFFTMKPILKSQ